MRKLSKWEQELQAIENRNIVDMIDFINSQIKKSHINHTKNEQESNKQKQSKFTQLTFKF